MTESEQKAINERIGNLEKRYKRLKQVCSATGLVLASIFTLGQAQSSRTLEANEFVLKDQAGKVRAKLFMDKTRDPSLILYDANGGERLTLVQAPDGTALILTNNPKERYGGVQLVLTADGPGLSMASVKHRRVISLSTFPVGPALSLTDAEGYEARIGVTDTEFPVSGEKQKSSAASIKLIGKDREILWSAPH